MRQIPDTLPDIAQILPNHYFFIFCGIQENQDLRNTVNHKTDK